MNKMMQRSALALTLLTGGSLCASYKDITTPLPLYTGRVGYVHYDRFEPVDNCADMIIQPWGAGYYRSAIDAYGPAGNKCNGECFPNSRARETISALLFGKDDFRIVEAFANGTTSGGNNPFLLISTISPRFDYREQGAFFGLVLGKSFGCDDTWHAGARFEIPYRDIEMEDKCSDLVGETVNDVFVADRQESIKVDTGEKTNSAWAARLDYLSALNQLALDAANQPVKLVIYNDPVGSPPAPKMTIGRQSVQASSAAPTDTTPVVSAIASLDGSIPYSQRWANTPQSATGAIAADGSGLLNLQRGYFQQTPGLYAGAGSLQTNTARQAQLWIVPNVDGTGTTTQPPVTLSGSDTMYTEISSSSGAVEPSVTPFLQRIGADFCSGRSKGVGDLDIELFLNKQWECGWVEFQMGFRFPTAKALNNPLQLIKPTLGNGGHYEIRPGLVLGCQHLDYIRFMADMTYSFVLKRTEYLPASFVGATVQNFGPRTPATVSWSYFTGTFGATFVHPYNSTMGCTLAYEPYVKQQSKVSYCFGKILDFNGALQVLDPKLAEKNTDRVSHKIRSEIFYAGDCCNIYGGFAQVVAGKNITRDTDLYLGILVSF